MASLDWKCALATAVATVLVYIVLVYITESANRPYQVEPVWYKSMEFLMLVSVVAAVNLNNNFGMADCRA